jgi:hypothetical protein
LSQTYNASHSLIIGFSMDGYSNAYNFSDTLSYNLTYSLDGDYNSSTPTANTQTRATTLNNIVYELNDFCVYAKLTPVCKIQELIDYSYNGVATSSPSVRNIFIESATPADKIAYYELIDATNTITFPSKNHPPYNPPGYRTIAGYSGTPDPLTGWSKILYITDLRTFNHLNAVVLTDKNNSHLAAWGSHQNYPVDSHDLAAGLMTNSALTPVTDLSTLIATPFYIEDFIGAV